MRRKYTPNTSDSQADLFADPASPPAASSIVERASFAPPLRAQFDALPPAWANLMASFTVMPACDALCDFVDAEAVGGKPIYPRDVFHALRATAPDDVKVVILGQDPYHGEENGIPQAHGLAFSVQPGIRIPPSLRNIYKEIERDLGIAPPAHGCLESWAQQGVLLLNTVLTVEKSRAASHAKRFKNGGWETCTDNLLRQLAQHRRELVFMLWGSHAQAKAPLLEGHGHLLLEAPHPSPLSAHRGFLGCGHFSAANAFLEQHGKRTIDWRIPNPK